MSDTTSFSPASDTPTAASAGAGTVTLKVLTGSQMGVEVNLPEGLFTFGADEAADVRFLDVTMAPLHGQIRIGGGKIQLQATGGAIVTGSGLAIEPGGDSWHEIAQLDRIRAGMTQFAIGERAARWADLLAGADPVAAGAARRSGGAGRAGGRSLMVPALAILLALAVAGLIWQGTTRAGPAVSQADTTATASALQAAIDGFAFAPQLRLEVEADGRNIVSGYVETAAERRAVEAAVAAIDPVARRRIWVREAMRADIDGMIVSQGLDVAAQVAEDGTVRLEGRVLDPAQAATLVGMIANEVFGVAGVEDRIETAEDILASVNGLLDQAGLGDLVIARLDGLLIETTGVIPNVRAERWIGFVQTYANRYAEILPLRSFVSLESAPAAGVAEPLVVGGAGQIGALAGRRIPTERLGPDQDLRIEEVFGNLPGTGTGTGTGQTPPGGDIGPQGALAPGAADGQETASTPSPVATQMVLDFAARNPALVDTIIREVTGGRFTGLDELRAMPSPDVVLQTADDTAALQQDAPPAAARSAPSLLVTPGAAMALPFLPALTGDAGAPAAGAGAAPPPADDAGSQAPLAMLVATDLAAATTGAGGAGADLVLAQAAPRGDGAPPLAPAAGLDPLLGPEPPPDTASQGAFTRFPTVRRADLGIVGATAALLQQDSLQALALPAASDRTPLAGRVTPDLLRLVREQQTALAQGGSLLPPPRPEPAPLAAQPADPAAAARAGCWRDGHVDPADIPAVLLWLDMLSLGESGGLDQLDLQTQLQVFDVALSPGRLMRCMGSERLDYGQQLFAASAFLNEIWRNEGFLDYVFRDVARMDLPISGVDLSGQRRLALDDQRMLREGAAPDAASRVAVIGELGALVRVRDGFRLTLYPSELDWKVKE
jgi:type III secretion system YscD/HrpQ family protein